MCQQVWLSYVWIVVGRGVEVVESTVRQHVGACFSALEKKVLDQLKDTSERLTSNSTASTQDKPLLQVCVQQPLPLQALVSMSLHETMHPCQIGHPKSSLEHKQECCHI